MISIDTYTKQTSVQVPPKQHNPEQQHCFFPVLISTEQSMYIYDTYIIMSKRLQYKLLFCMIYVCKKNPMRFHNRYKPVDIFMFKLFIIQNKYYLCWISMPSGLYVKCILSVDTKQRNTFNIRPFWTDVGVNNIETDNSSITLMSLKALPLSTSFEHVARSFSIIKFLKYIFRNKGLKLETFIIGSFNRQPSLSIC